jgi:hypothetical protein
MPIRKYVSNTLGHYFLELSHTIAFTVLAKINGPNKFIPLNTNIITKFITTINLSQKFFFHILGSENLIAFFKANVDSFSLSIYFLLLLFFRFVINKFEVSEILFRDRFLKF